jgi:HEAT repeat protein
MGTLVCFCVLGRTPVGYGQTDRIGQLISQLEHPFLHCTTIECGEAVHRATLNELRQIGAPAVEPLIAALSQPTQYTRSKGGAHHQKKGVRHKTGARCNLAEALGVIKDLRAVEPLIAALRDEDPDVRSSSADALGEIGDSRAVEPLVAALKAKEDAKRHPGDWGDKNNDFEARKRAGYALERIGAPAVEPLIAALKDKLPDADRRHLQRQGRGDELMAREIEAKALSRIKDPRAVSALVAALRERDMEVISAVYEFFIARAEPGSEDILIEVLDGSGDPTMAEVFLECGNPKLESAAAGWASRNGYRRARRFGMAGGEPLLWGSSR